MLHLMNRLDFLKFLISFREFSYISQIFRVLKDRMMKVCARFIYYLISYRFRVSVAANEEGTFN